MTQKNNHQHNTQTENDELTIVRTRTGKCDICKTTKKILLLSYGFNLCQDCIDICTQILEQIQLEETKTTTQQTPPPQQITLTGTQTT